MRNVPKTDCAGKAYLYIYINAKNRFLFLKRTRWIFERVSKCNFITVVFAILQSHTYLMTKHS